MRHIFSSFMICLSLCCAHTSVALAAQNGFTLSTKIHLNHILRCPNPDCRR